MDVLHSQEGFAERLAAASLPVGDDAAAQVDQMEAHGKVVAHVDVRPSTETAVQPWQSSGVGRSSGNPSQPVRAEM